MKVEANVPQVAEEAEATEEEGARVRIQTRIEAQFQLTNYSLQQGTIKLRTSLN